MKPHDQLPAILLFMMLCAATADGIVTGEGPAEPTDSRSLVLSGPNGDSRANDNFDDTTSDPERIAPTPDSQRTSSRDHGTSRSVGKTKTGFANHIPTHVAGAAIPFGAGTFPPWVQDPFPRSHIEFVSDHIPEGGERGCIHQDLSERFAPAALSNTWSSDLLRFGWWGTAWDGSPAKIGEWQDLRPSPFFDVDALHSNGRHSTSLNLGGTDQETNDLDLYRYQPALTTEIEYDRFVHRRERDPLNNFTDVDAPIVPPDVMVKDDLNTGPDYAVRVQELKASFKTRLTANLRMRLDVWGMRRNGMRQANAMADCFHLPNSANPADGRCHVLTRPQRIDWITMEVKPVVEWKQGPLAVEYSRPMRGFQQDDQVVTRRYGPRRVPTFVFDGMFALRPDVDYAYGVTPENFTQIDQVKLGWDVNASNKFYGFLFHGNTENKNIELERSFSSVDLRLTNRTLDNITLTPYFRHYAENTSVPDEHLIEQIIPENGIPIPGETESAIAGLRLINRRYSKAGLRGVWRPFGGGFGRKGLSLRGGYQYHDLERQYALFDPGFDADSTTTHQLWLTPKMRWSPRLESFLRYRLRLAKQPLFGTRVISDATGVGPDLPFANTLLPEQDNLIEIGGTWSPSDRFLISTTFGFAQRYHSPIDLGPAIPFSGGRFVENAFPASCSAWYQVNGRWSLTAGAAYFSEPANHDITLGDDYAVDPAAPGAFLRPISSRWTYTGRAEIYNVGSRYAVRDTMWLTGDVEIVNGLNTISTAAFSDIPSFSAVNVATTRLNVGFDWLPLERFSAYFRYILYRYDDETSIFNTGTSHMFLGGVSTTL